MPSHAQMACRHDSYYSAFHPLELRLANAARKDLKRDGLCLELAAEMSLFFTSRWRRFKHIILACDSGYCHVLSLQDWCFWFCFIFQKIEVGSKASMTLSGHLAEMHVCGRTLLAYVIMLLGTHVVHGNGYPRCYESVGSFFSSSCFCITEWRKSMAYDGFMHTEHVGGHQDLCSCHVLF